MYDIPVLLLIFNRLDTTVQVLKKLQEIKPKLVYIAADGWRQNRSGEKEACLNTRKEVLQMIDWECEVHTLFREKNLGCGKAVSSAVTWFFNNVEYGIILEDDCLPNDSFFHFCREMLYRYKDDDRVMHISGSNFQLSDVSEHSYYFSNSIFMWGWASWSRAWKHYDFEMKDFDLKMDLNNYVSSKEEETYWRQVFNAAKTGLIDTWDFQWYYACWKNNGLSIMPRVNMVKNLGFGSSATHTKNAGFLSNLKTSEIGKLIHPEEVKRNVEADCWQAQIMRTKSLHPFKQLVTYYKGYIKGHLKKSVLARILT